MADLPISSAAALTHSTIAAGDLFPVLDVSASAGSKGSKITLAELANSVNATLLGSANTFTAANTFATGVITSNTPAISITQTWNNASEGFKLITSDVTILTADYANTAFVDLKLNGTTRFKMDHGGSCFFGSNNAGTATFIVDTNSVFVTLRNGAWLDWMGDTGIYRDQPGTISIRQYSGAASLCLFGARTNSNNYERLSFITTAGDYTIEPEAAGTGTLRALNIGASGSLTRLVGSTVFSINGAASSPAISLTGTVFTGGSATTTKPSFLIEPSGTLSTSWSTSGTAIGVNAASGFAGKLMDAQISGVSRFDVDAENGVTCGYQTSWGVGSEVILTLKGKYGTAFIQSGESGMHCSSNWRSNALAVTDASGLHSGWLEYADVDNCIEQRRGTSANIFRVYGTFTDASNFERLSFITTAGAYSIKPEAAGTGTLRTLQISGLPTSNPGPGILWNNAGTPAIGT